jgi:hypothetical protein
VLVAKPSFIWWLLRWLCLFVWAVALAHGPSLVLKRCETKVCVDIVVSFYHEMEPGRCLPVNLKKTEILTITMDGHRLFLQKVAQTTISILL